MSSDITIRRSTDADRAQLAQLAELDSRSAPEGDAMLGFVGDELWAALDVESGTAVADPFHPTAELLELLRVSVGERRHNTFGLRAFRHVAEAA